MSKNTVNRVNDKKTVLNRILIRTQELNFVVYFWKESTKIVFDMRKTENEFNAI